MPEAADNLDKYRAYRQRLAANGLHQFIAALPRETVAYVDEFQQRQGLRSRSQALLQLIEQGRQPPSINPQMRKPALPGGLLRNS
jgi:hypothetical protein